VIYAGRQGVWKSVDGGATWSITGLTDREQYSLAIDPVTPTTLYAGRNGAIAKSTDGGVSWTSVAIVGDVYGLLIDPTSPTTLYATVSAIGGWTVLKSTDGGSSWIETPPPVHLVVNGFAIDASRPTTLYAVASDPRVAGAGCCIVFKSTDGGASWTEQGNVLANSFLLVTDPVTPGTLFAGGDLGIFKSIDNGGNWAAAGPAVHALVIDPLNPTTLHAARTDYDCFEVWGDFQCLLTGVIYKSTDGAASWTQVAAFPDLGIYALTIDPLTPTTLYAGGQGLVKSTDGGATWSAPQPPPSPPPADTTPPDTSITSAADGTGTALAAGAVTLSTSLTLSFAGADNIGLSRFECQLDGGGFSHCTSSLAYTALSLGRHTFEVRAVDAAGNVDATPARHTWTVDAAPQTTISSAVDARAKLIPNGGSTTSDAMTFRFSGTDNGTVVRFECRLDAGNFTTCASPLTYTRVPGGARTFQVRAVDNNGFPDPSPAVFTWTALRPKLTVTTLTVPARGAIGQTMSVPNTVRNTGQGPAGPFVVQFHLSADPVLDAGDVVLGQRTINSLAAGGSSAATMSLRLPDTTVAGRYYVVTVADAFNQQEEAQGSNKIAVAGPLDVIPYRPELTLTALTVPAYGVVNQTMTLTNAIRNNGLAPAGAFAVRFYLSSDSLLDGGDRALGDRAVGGLAPGVQSAASTTLLIPTGTVVGRYQVIAVVDVGSKQTELDEANNITVSAPFSVLAHRPTDGTDTGECGAARPLGWVRPPACAPPNPTDGGDGEELQFPEQLRPEPAAVRRLL